MNETIFNYKVYLVDHDSKKVYLKFDWETTEFFEDSRENWENICITCNGKYPEYRIIFKDYDLLDWEELVHDKGIFKLVAFYQEGNYN